MPLDAPVETTLAEAQERTFRYSRFLRTLFLVGAGFFLSITVLALQARPENGGGLAWPAAAFLIFGLLNCWLLWAVLPSFRTDAEGITTTRLGTESKVFWRHIQRIEHRPMTSALVIATGTEELRVQRQLEGFLAFRDILLAKAPISAEEPALSLPFRAPASWSLRIVFGGMALFFLSMAAYSAFSSGDWRTVLMMFAFGMGNSALLAWQAILRVDFEPTYIRLVYPARQVTIRASELEGVTLFQRGWDIVLLLHVAGKSKPIEISDNQFTIAPERIYEAIAPGYGLSTEDD